MLLFIVLSLNYILVDLFLFLFLFCFSSDYSDILLPCQLAALITSIYVAYLRAYKQIFSKTILSVAKCGSFTIADLAGFNVWDIREATVQKKEFHLMMQLRIFKNFKPVCSSLSVYIYRVISTNSLGLANETTIKKVH